jgi:hypothetical protein
MDRQDTAAARKIEQNNKPHVSNGVFHMVLQFLKDRA